MIRWVLVVLLALILIDGLSPLVEATGCGEVARGLGVHFYGARVATAAHQHPDFEWGLRFDCQVFVGKTGHGLSCILWDLSLDQAFLLESWGSLGLVHTIFANRG